MGVSARSLLTGFWKAVVGIDLLHKALLKTRPYARDVEQAERVYQELLDEWCRRIEARESIKQLAAFMGQAARRLADVPADRTTLKPKIGIVGEIYVRMHPSANKDIIRQLEALGAECDLAGFAEWVYYVNSNNVSESRRRRAWPVHFGLRLQDTVQHTIERRLARPLQQRFGTLAEGPTEHMLKLAAPYIDRAFEGEAVLSVGKILELYQHGAGGVVNVMPFSCMPSTVVSTQTQRLSKECDGMPILNISFDGQEDPALITRLEAFVEQVRQRRADAVNEPSPVSG